MTGTRQARDGHMGPLQLLVMCALLLLVLVLVEYDDEDDLHVCSYDYYWCYTRQARDRHARGA